MQRGEAPPRAHHSCGPARRAPPPAVRARSVGPFEPPTPTPSDRRGGYRTSVPARGVQMASVRIREAEEGDCGQILRLIRVTAAGREPGAREGVRAARPGEGCGAGSRGPLP